MTLASELLSEDDISRNKDERIVEVNELIKKIEGYQHGYIILYLAISVYVYSVAVEFRE